MDKVSFARARAGHRKRQFEMPAIPAWPLNEPFDGFALWQDGGWDPTSLRPWRDTLKQVIHFTVPLGHGSRPLLVGMFATPQLGSTSLPAGALPLRRLAKGWISSAGEADDTPSPTATVHSLKLFWEGRYFTLSLAEGEAVGVSPLWDKPHLIIHRPVRRRFTDQVANADVPARRGRNAGAAQVERSPGQGLDPFATVKGDLDRLDESTRLGSILKSAFTRLRKGGKGSEKQAGSAEPSLKDQLAGWLRWHSPFRSSLKRLWKDRANLVEDLIRRGDADLALRLAIKLGSSSAHLKKPKQVYPLRPGVRSSFDLSITNQQFDAGLIEGEEERLRRRYAELAQQLESGGDFLRAAFVHSQLLGNHAAGVSVLERGGFFREAARLALEAHLSLNTIIRLHYLAGDHEAALLLARRHENFHLLASLSRDSHPGFHEFVISAWTERLVAMGAPLMALQVTDDLVSGKGARDAHPNLLECRREWLLLAQAGQEGGIETPEIGIRSLLMLPPPGAAGILPEPSFAPTPENLLMLQKFADQASPEQETFWSVHAAGVIDSLVRRSLRLAGDELHKVHRETLVALCRAADLEVLRFDVSRLALTAPQAKPADRDWALPPAAQGLSTILLGCVLDDERAVIWRESGMVELWSALGERTWMAPLQDVVGLVAAGISGTVLVLQQGGGEPLVRLSRFIVAYRRIEFIAELPLRGWHDVTSDTAWMVQVGGDTGALDLPLLLGKAPRVDFTWSVQVTDEIRTVAFFHEAEPEWITYDAREGSGPLYEGWKLTTSGKVKNTILNPGQRSPLDGRAPPFDERAGQLYFNRRSIQPREAPPTVDVPFGDWIWTSHSILGVDRFATGRRFTFETADWSLQAARQARVRMMERIDPLAEGGAMVDRFLSADLGRCDFSILNGDPASAKLDRKMEFTVSGSRRALISITSNIQDQLSVLARGRKVATGKPADKERGQGSVLLADAHGRLVRVDLVAERVDIFS